MNKREWSRQGIDSTRKFVCFSLGLPSATRRFLLPGASVHVQHLNGCVVSSRPESQLMRGTWAPCTPPTSPELCNIVCVSCLTHSCRIVVNNRSQRRSRPRRWRELRGVTNRIVRASRVFVGSANSSRTSGSRDVHSFSRFLADGRRSRKRGRSWSPSNVRKKMNF